MGYGDVYPKTPIGRGVAVLLMLIGISLFGLLTARVAAFFVESNKEAPTQTGQQEIMQRLERIEERLRELQATGRE